MLHAVLSQLQMSGVLKKDRRHTGSAYKPTQETIHMQTHSYDTHLAELLLVLRHLLQHLGQVSHCGLFKWKQGIDEG